MSSQIIGAINNDGYHLKSDIDYLNSVTKLPEEYDEFGQGYWKNLSLYNSSGISADSQYRDTECCYPTEYAKNCPQITRLIDENFSHDGLKMVRARSLVDGMVIPHRDFVELDTSLLYFRVFVPLETNEDAYHSDESGVFQMRAGEVWFLDAGINHAAINFGGDSRMFLCLDYIFGKPFNHVDIFRPTAKLVPSRSDYLIKRKPMSSKMREEIITGTSKIVDRRTFKDLVFALSKYHFIYDVPVAECYDWIIQAAELAGDKEVVNKALRLRTYLIEQRDLGERYVINDWAA